MDAAWAEQRLEDYLAAVRQYDAQLLVDGYDADLYDKAIRQEPTARRIMSELLDEVPSWILNSGGATRVAMDAALYALAVLRDQDEVEANLGPTGPRISASKLHPLVWSAAAELWDDGHYGPAVQRAATFVNAEVQARTDRHDGPDAALMQSVFSEQPPKAEQPRLRWPGDAKDKTVKSMNAGLRLLAPGVFMTVRNPTTHSINDLPEQRAAEQLATLSLLARWLEECVI